MSQHKPKVVVTRRLPSGVLDELAGIADLDVWQGEECIPQGELKSRLGTAQGLLCMLTESLDENLVAAAPALRCVSSMSVGVDHVDVAALNARGIPLGHTPGVLVETTADLQFSLMLAAARRVVEADRFVRNGQWQWSRRWAPDMLLGKDVHGATLGIIGLGEIGQAMARRAQGFGMRVLGWSRSARQVDGIETMAFEQVLANSDFISINVALTADTRGLIDAPAIKRMKPGAVLVNAARGGIVDEQALAAALKRGQLMAAGIDVFAEEPVSANNPLLGLPNVVLAPHIGSASESTRWRMAELAVNNLVAGLRGEEMPHCANPEVYCG